jgi:septum formation protein
MAGKNDESGDNRMDDDHGGGSGKDDACHTNNNDDGPSPVLPPLPSILSNLHLSSDRPLLLGSASFTRRLILKEMGIPFSKLVRPIDERALGDRTGGGDNGGPGTSAPHDLVLLLANAKMDHLVEELRVGRCDGDLPPQPPRTSTSAAAGDEGSSSSSMGSSSSWILLTGDQVVTCENQILEKPESVDEAKLFLRMYGRSPPSTVGSCVLHHHPSGIRVSGVDTATIHFRSSLVVDASVDANDGDEDESRHGDGVRGGGGGSCDDDPTISLIDRLIMAGEPVMSCAGGLMIEHPLVEEHVERIDGTVDSVMGLSKVLVHRLMLELSLKLQDCCSKAT